MIYSNGTVKSNVYKMKLQSLNCVLLLLLLNSCSNPNREVTPAPAKPVTQAIVKSKPHSSFRDTVIINSPAAIFYHPDSLQLIKIKAANDSSVFKSMMHELFYQARNSRIVLKKYYPHLKVVDVTNARWLLFVKKDGTKEYIDLDKYDDPEGFFIFDAGKSPRLVDMMNIETELGFYFPQKSRS